MTHESPIYSEQALQSRIDDIPRLQIAHLPTPLEYCPRLTEALGGPEIWMKRDDCTGLAFGGNKTRQLEFILSSVPLHNPTGAVKPRLLHANLA